MDKASELKEIIENSDNIVFFGGAGVSTESGIPDFRSPQGLYNAQQKYGCSPETILSHSFFMNHRKTFFDFYVNNMIYKDAKPGPTHIALAELERQGKVKAIVTQNIDGLHARAGSKKVYELHGKTDSNYCMDCGERYDTDFVLGFSGEVPLCSICGGTVRPDVVLYEEGLDDGTLRGAIEAISSCDVLIVGGTSLTVYPAAGLINYFVGRKIVLINKEPTPYDSKADLVIHDSIGKTLARAMGQGSRAEESGDKCCGK